MIQTNILYYMKNIFPSLKQKPLKMLTNIFCTIIVQNLCSAKVKFQLVGRGYGAAGWWHHALTNGGVGSVQQGIMRNAQFRSRIVYCTIGIVHNAQLELCTTRNPDCPRCTIGILCTIVAWQCGNLRGRTIGIMRILNGSMVDNGSSDLSVT